MNQKLIQINDNYGVTIDENGNTKMVSKESNDYEFQDILTKENECIKNGSLANMLDNLWTKLSKKLDFNYETNFSNLNKH